MHTRLKVAAAVLIALGATQARATGIPVIDVANLFQAVQQVINDITQIAQRNGMLDIGFVATKEKGQ